MARSIPQVQPIPGVKDFLTLLEFVKDPDKLGAKVAELEALRLACNESVELVGKAAEIEGMHLRARQDEQAAAQQLAAAKDEAHRIADEATARIGRAELILETAQTEFASASRTTLAALARQQDDLDERAAALASRETAVAARERAATALQAQVEALQRETEAKAATLRSAAAAVA